ncbi:hypothetical protein JCM5353_007997 [Sporobolomyces roseus]
MSSAISQPPASSGECVVRDGHRKVCGQAGNPFRWPSLSQSEIELFERVASEPNPKRGGKSWFETKARGMENPAEPGFFSRLGKNPSIPFSEEELRLRSNLVGRIRQELPWVKADLATLPGKTMEDAVLLIQHDPFGMLIHIETKAWLGFLDRYDEDWWNEFQHRMILLFTIANDSIGGFMAASTGKDQALRYTFAQVRRMCQEVITKHYPREAEVLIGLVEEKCMKGLNA